MGRPARLENRVVEEIVSSLVRVLPVVRIVLFGSYARGDYHEASDVDLLVIVRDEIDWFERTKRARDAITDAGIGFVVEPHVYTLADYHAMRERGNRLVERAETEGIVVYEQ